MKNDHKKILSEYGFWYGGSPRGGFCECLHEFQGNPWNVRHFIQNHRYEPHGDLKGK